MTKIGKKDKSPVFANKQTRFDKDDTLPPGPGTYKLHDSCSVRDPKLVVASYKSGTVRELGDHIRGKDNPGIGEYDLTGFNAIGKNTFEGGGAPNNFTLCYKDLNPTIRKVEARPSPRIAPAVSNSKYLIFSTIEL